MLIYNIGIIDYLMESQVKVNRRITCTVNRRSLKALAISQLALAIALALFTTVIDPPSSISIAIAALTTVIEGTSVGYVLHYLRRGCFT